MKLYNKSFSYGINNKYIYYNIRRNNDILYYKIMI